MSATFGVAPPFTKRALLWRMHPSVLGNDAACSLVHTLLEVNGLLHNYALRSQWRALKRHIARIFRAHSIAAARERATTLTTARDDLERHVRQDASRENLQAAARTESGLQAAQVFRQQEAARALKAKELMSVSRLPTKHEATYPRALFGDGRRLTTTAPEVEQLCADHFAGLFAKEAIDEQCGEELLNAWTSPEIPAELRQSLAAEFTITDLRAALPRSDLDTMPGPDGLPWQFYRKFWPLVSVILHKVLRHSLRCGKLPPGMSESVVRRIPKADRDPKLITSWRPITLLNCDHKLFSHLVNRRLQGYLKVVIHPDQVGFMPGRQINEHLIVMRALASQNKGAVLLTDDDAAYDRISRQWLLAVAQRVVDPQLLKLLTMMTAPGTTRLLLETLSRPIEVQRGVPQGLPLSPSLYNLASEPLLAALRNTNAAGLRSPLGDRVLTLAYADDKAMCMASPDDLALVKPIIAKYERASGALINPSKSSLVILDGSPARLWQASWAALKCVSIKNTSPLYLGLPLRGDPYERPRQRLSAAIKSWNGVHLPLFARAHVANKFLLPLFTYVASVSAPPHDLVHTTKRVSAYVWSSAIGSKRHPTIHIPQGAGGLGVRHLETAMEAMRLQLLRRLQSTVAAPADALEAPHPPIWAQFCLAALARSGSAHVLPPSLRTQYASFPPLAELPTIMDAAFTARLGGYGTFFTQVNAVDAPTVNICDAEVNIVKMENKEFYYQLVPKRLPQFPWTPWPAAPQLRPSARTWSQIHAATSSFYHREARWRMINRCHPLNYRLYEADDPRTNCARGCPVRETYEHAFLECPVVRSLWDTMLTRIRSLWTLPPMPSLLQLLVSPDTMICSLPQETQKRLTFVLNCVVRHIWRMRPSAYTAAPVTTSPQHLLASFEASLVHDLTIIKALDPSLETWISALRPLYSG